MSCSRSRRKRPPPSAVRMASSRRRAAERAVSRLATLRQAISSMHPVAASNTYNAGLMSPTRASMSARMAAPLLTNGLSTLASWMWRTMAESSCAACWGLTLGFSLPITPEPVIVDRSHVLGRFLVVRRKEDLDFRLGEAEPTRHHADDGVGLGIEIDLAADDGSVSAEAAFPKHPTEYGGALGGWLIIFGRERASDEGLDTKRGKQVPGTNRSADLLGQRAAVRQVVLRPVLIQREAGERLALAFPFAINARRGPVKGEALAALVQSNELLRAIERQRFQENRPDDGEQRDSRPYANSDHQHRHRGKPRLPCERADA